jgi:hypothetical protein
MGDVLSSRFESFIRTMSGFEDIDSLLRGQNSKNQADYLLWNRKIILEQKILVVDPGHRPQKFVDTLLQERRMAMFGTLSTRYIFDRLTDGTELERDMFLDMTKGLGDNTEHADRQIRDTREIFSIRDAIGVLILLNESAPTLRPDLVTFRLNNIFGKRSAGGSFRYPNIDGVVLISESHTLHGPQGNGAPCFAWPTLHARSRDDFLRFSYAMIKGWSSYNNLPFLDMSQHGN